MGGILTLVFVWSCLNGESIIRQGENEYHEYLTADTHIVEALLDKDAVGKLYIEPVPEFYKREFRGISDKILSAEGLAKKENTSLIVEDERELWILIAAGYEYGRLASGHAIYTNSEGAKTILEGLGVMLTDYYSRQETLNLKDVAVRNDLVMTKEGTLLLSEQDGSICYGPCITVYKGTLRVEYKLHLLNNTLNTDIVATAKITSDGGIKEWLKKDILLNDFDEYGNCLFVLDRILAYNCPNVEFLLSVSDGVELEVQEISYGKIE